MFNARSLRNKFSDLEALATSEDCHIIAVSDSWFKTENRDFLAEYDFAKLFNIQLRIKKLVFFFT